jgi:hypothetical protein
VVQPLPRIPSCAFQTHNFPIKTCRTPRVGHSAACPCMARPHAATLAKPLPCENPFLAAASPCPLRASGVRNIDITPFLPHIESLQAAPPKTLTAVLDCEMPYDDCLFGSPVRER